MITNIWVVSGEPLLAKLKGGVHSSMTIIESIHQIHAGKYVWPCAKMGAIASFGYYQGIVVTCVWGQALARLRWLEKSHGCACKESSGSCVSN